MGMSTHGNLQSLHNISEIPRSLDTRARPRGDQSALEVFDGWYPWLPRLGIEYKSSKGWGYDDVGNEVGQRFLYSLRSVVSSSRVAEYNDAPSCSSAGSRCPCSYPAAPISAPTRRRGLSGTSTGRTRASPAGSRSSVPVFSGSFTGTKEQSYLPEPGREVRHSLWRDLRLLKGEQPSGQIWECILNIRPLLPGVPGQVLRQSVLDI